MRKGSTIVRVVCAYAPAELPRAWIALLLAAVFALALLAAVGGSRVGAQGGCRTTADLGALSSYQTLTRTELLNESSCKFENVQYYDQYFFTMPGTGTVSVSVSAPDIRAQIVFNTESGELIAGRLGSISRMFPAGRYRILIVSTYHRDAGVYTVTIKTGKIDAPPPPPEPEQQELQPGGQQTQNAATAPGQIAVQVVPLPSGDQRGSYQVQFAFLTDAVLSSAASRSAAVEANQNLWPQPRVVRGSTLRQRAQDNNRRWMRSGLVTLPVSLSDGRSATLKGYVIARQAARSGESVRLEFGFLPERALRNANNDVQVAARAALIPDLYVLLESKITEVVQRGSARWFFSSSVNAPLDVEPPRQSITITPGAALSLQRGQSSGPAAIATVSAGAQWTATLSGLPPGLQYQSGPFPAGQGPINVFGTVLPSAEARPYMVGVTVRDESGQTQSTGVTITVTEPERKDIRITWHGYLSTQVEVDNQISAVRPQIVSPSPPPSSAQITYRSSTPSICIADPMSGAIRAVSAGSCQVTATATAAGYQSGTARASVTVIEQKVIRITWGGYQGTQVEVGDQLNAVRPQIISPSPPPSSAQITIRSDTPSICAVVPGTGAIRGVSAGSCQVTATASAPGYQPGTARATVTVIEQKVISITWHGYLSAQLEVGNQISAVRPQIVSPSPPPSSARIVYRSDTPSICSADAMSGAIRGVSTGSCQVTATATAPGYQPGMARATVTVIEQRVIRITWGGYQSTQVEVGDQLNALRPQIISPSPPPPSAQITIRSDTPSICAVVPVTGAIRGVSAGSCRVTATATAPGYQSGTADAHVSVVPRRKVTPTILWTGYGLSRATAGQGPLRPQTPQGLVGRQPVQLLYSYQAWPTNVCQVNRSTGILTLAGAGQCNVTVSSLETDRYNAARTTVSLTIDPQKQNRPPTANPAPPKTLYLGCGIRPPEPQPSVQLWPLFSDPDGDELTYSVVQYDSSLVTASISAWFNNSLRIQVAAGVDRTASTIVRFRATDPGGLSGDNVMTVTIAPCPGPGHTVEGGDDNTDDDGIGVVDDPYDRGPYPP